MMMMTKFGLLVLVVMIIGGTEAQTSGSCRTNNGQQGTCISLRDCPELLGLLASIRSGTAPAGSIDVLRSAICRFINNQPLVCCTAATTQRPIPTPSRRPQPTTVLPSQCGINGLTDFIIDGVPAPLAAWPWMVILRGSSGRGSIWFCGGTLISDRYVLTAAHCFKEVGVTLEYARIGEQNLQTNPDCEFGICAPPPQNIPVETIIRHPSYGSPCRECNDIALLRLSRPAILHPRYVTPICLPMNPVRDMGFSVTQFRGKLAWAAGWGTTARDPTQIRNPSILQQVQLPIQDLRDCARLKRGYPDDAMVICAGGEGKDTCRGDSGGPLTLTNSGNTKHFLVGVTSIGPIVCGAQETQGLYTSVNHYIPWILQNLSG